MTYSHNFGAKLLAFNSSTNRSLLVAMRDELYHENQLTLGIEIKKKTRIKRGKIESFFRYHCSPDIMAIFFIF